jgi:hypothetical protein
VALPGHQGSRLNGFERVGNDFYPALPQLGARFIVGQPAREQMHFASAGTVRKRRQHVGQRADTTLAQQVANGRAKRGAVPPLRNNKQA